ncbi:jg14388 [Pararge aegeria aegeria]|uniref:Jg14388 protein n=1 Tax=Pararge aegeria aegeria TaxID=348720 RepID=A0A8S4RA97_9NEOP|nr:jg14388 [Pararge aegeria aegeria]
MRITLEDWTDGVSIGGYKISNLRYADDTTLFATSARHMEELLLKMERVSLEFGLKINHNKTKMMIVDRANNNSEARSHPPDRELRGRTIRHIPWCFNFGQWRLRRRSKLTYGNS